VSNEKSVIPPHSVALGRHAFAHQFGSYEEIAAARQVLAAARIRDVALKSMQGAKPLTRAQTRELVAIFRGEGVEGIYKAETAEGGASE
jgi:hypothetical protein